MKIQDTQSHFTTQASALSVCDLPKDVRIERKKGKEIDKHQPSLLIDKEQASARIFSSPVLTEPSRINFSELRLISTINSIHTSSESLINSFSDSISSSCDKLKSYCFEQIEKLKEAALKAKESDFWSFLQKVAECVLAAISTVLGVSLVSSGAGSIVGGVMIASGLLTLSNFIMRETGSWNYLAEKLSTERKDREWIATYLPHAVNLLCGIVSACSGSVAGLWQNLDFTQKALLIAQSALGTMQAATATANTISEAQGTWIESDLALIESKRKIESFQFDSSSNNLKQMLKIIQSSQDSAEQVIDLAAQARRKTMIQG